MEESRFSKCILLALVLGLIVCRQWNNPFDPLNRPRNRAPFVPSQPVPDNGATQQDTGRTLSWIGGDPDTWDKVTYDVFFGTVAEPPLVRSGLDTCSYRPGGLSFLVTYYWRIVSRDSSGESSAGPVWAFTTRAQSRTNRPPNTPSDPIPAHEATGLDTSLALLWTGGDPDSGDVVGYDVYLGTSLPPALVRAGNNTNSYRPTGLGLLTKYYWRIVAKDQAGDSAVGPVWNFTTRAQGDTNRPPYRPSRPVPDSGATGRSVKVVLSWSGGDPNPGDTARYDVYFGTSTTPPRIIQNQISTTYSPGTLSHGIVYYWRIVARDKRGAQTSGPLWWFRTVNQVSVTAPAAGSAWLVGTNQTIEWTGGTKEDQPQGGGEVCIRVQTSDSYSKGNRGTKVRPRLSDLLTSDFATDSTVVLYSTNDGTNWTRLGRAAQQGRYDWTVSGPGAESCRVLVRVHTSRDTVQARSERFRIWSVPTSVTITSPSSSTRWREGSSQTITWTGGTDGGQTQREGTVNFQGQISQSIIKNTMGQPWSLRFFDCPTEDFGPDSTVVFYSTDDGATWTRHGKAQAAGRYVWNVPGPAAAKARVQVRVYAVDSSRTGTSEAYVVYDSLPPSAITVTSPAAGTRWNVGTQQLVAWSGGTDGVDSSVIYYSRDGGTSWARQGRAVTQGQFSWFVPGPATDSGRIQVRAYCGQRTTAGTSGLFQVVFRYPDSVIATIRVGRKPRALCWNPTYNKVYVLNQDTDTVTVIDGSSNAVLAHIPVGDQPVTAVYNTAGNKLYVANEGSANVTVIDGATNAVRKTVPTGSSPTALVWNPVNNRVYCANWNANSVSVIDANSDSVRRTLATGLRPAAVCWNRAANKVYVPCAGSNQVTIIAGSGDSILTTIPVSTGPCFAVADTIANEVYVASQSAHRVSVIDGNTNMMLAVIPVGRGPGALAWNPTGGKVYSADREADSVSVISTQSHSVIGMAKTGTQPWALVWAPGFNMLYASCAVAGSVTVIGGESNLPEKTVPVGATPLALCWNASNSKVYVANYASGTVTIIGLRQ